MPPHSHRPPLDPLTTGAVGLAVVAVSSSAPLIAYAAAPALAIAFWRNMLAVAVLGPFSLARRRAEFRALAGPARRG
ncbi:EamA family transporter, partial [Micromonospora acroterricola]